MPEEKKRFQWWPVICAVLLLSLAAAVGLIETVGRRGTLVGQCERLREGMSHEQVTEIVGPHVEMDFFVLTDGPAEVGIWFDHDNRYLARKSDLSIEDAGFGWWRVRRWAEQAYTAIHGPRR